MLLGLQGEDQDVGALKDVQELVLTRREPPTHVDGVFLKCLVLDSDQLLVFRFENPSASESFQFSMLQRRNTS